MARRRERPGGYLPEREYQEQVKLTLERLYGEVEVQWLPFLGEGRGMYAPRVDIAIGPFAVAGQYIRRYTELMHATRRFIECLIERHNRNVEGIGEPATFGRLLDFNENARCFLCIEIEESGSRKHCIGNLVNVSALGRMGLLVARNDVVLRTFVRQRAYLQFLARVGKNTFKTMNALVLSEAQFDECLREIPERPQENGQERRPLPPPQDFAGMRPDDPTVFHVDVSPRSRRTGRTGYDQTAYWARSGLMFSMHNADGEPCRAVTGFGDHPTAMTLFAAIMLGLYRRVVTGQGSKVFTSLIANGAWSNANLIQAAQLGARFLPRTTRKTANPLVNHYVTSDQKRFLTCCLDPKKDWPNLCRALSREDLIDDERFRTQELRFANATSLVEIIDAVIATRNMAEWDGIFRRHGLTWAPVQSNQEAAQDQQMEANGVFDEIAPGIRTVSSPFLVEGVNKVKPCIAPQVGEHTWEVMRSLSYSDTEIVAMLERGSVSAQENSN